MMAEIEPRDQRIMIMSPSPALQPTIESVHSMTVSAVLSSSSEEPATRFDLKPDFMPIVEEAKSLYQKEKSPTESPKMSSHGAIFQQSPYVGRLHDTIVIPIVNEDNATVTARDMAGNKTNLVWEWSKFIFASNLTYFDVEEGKKVGAIVVHFRRE